MEKTQHTPGPWKVETYTTRGEFVTETCVRASDQSYLAKIGPCNIEANASLIAAAPDMFRAIQTALTTGLEDPGMRANAEALFRAAIEKATAHDKI